MNILDLQGEFNVNLEFIGDNETDLNLLTIQYMGIENSGLDIATQETYRMSREAVAEIHLGLRAMTAKFEKYLAEWGY
jgi:hypothetical protein